MKVKSLSRVRLYTCSIKSTAALNAKATSTGQCCTYAGHSTVSSRSEQALQVPKGRRAPGQQGRSVSLAHPLSNTRPWLQERPGQTQLHHYFFSFNQKERKAKKVNTQIFTEITQIFNNSHPRAVRQTGLYIHVNLQNASV